MTAPGRQARAPLVTIAISAYNAEPFIADACRSALHQTHPSVEVIVVDDGSSDGTSAIVESLGDERIRLHHQANSGKSVALNYILDTMRGEYLVIQDADDLSDQTRVQHQLDALMTNPELAAVFCGHRLILNGRETGPRFAARSPEECAAMIQRYLMPAHDPTIMVRADVAKKNRFNPKLRIGQGYDFTLRVGEQHAMCVLGECLYSYRVNPHSVTRQDAERRQKYVEQVLSDARNRRGEDAPSINSTSRRRGHVMADNNLVGHFVESVRGLRQDGRFGSAVRAAADCLTLHPMDWRYYKPLANCIAPISFIEWWKRRKN